MKGFGTWEFLCKRSKMYKLENKVSIVTGAAHTRGIGGAIARRLAREGSDLVLMDLCLNESAKEQIETLRNDIEKMGRKSLVFIGDVTNKNDVILMLSQAIEQFQKIDILVNNAGIGGPQKIVVDISEEEWDRIIEVNLKGAFLCSKTVAAHMISQKIPGKIINIASQAGKRGFVFQGAYCASKFGMIGLTQVMALELAKYKITVNAVCPGTVDTDMIDQMFENLAKLSNKPIEEIKEKIIKRQIPLGRLEKSDEIANVVAWIASSEADYMTGESVNITGGQTMD